jgi:L-ascorbate metabolism protein UlaG (beta-lactamase superfamily)
LRNSSYSLQNDRNERSHPRSSGRFTYLGHASTLIELDGVTILTDPLLRQRTAHLRRTSVIDQSAALLTPDVVLISHMHWDHLDLPSLRMISPDTLVIGPVGSGTVLRRAGLTNVVELGEGAYQVAGDVAIQATPANHDGSRPPFGPDGEAIGFVITGSQTVYFAGDTDLFDGMSSLVSNLDVALLPVWGWGPTLGPGHLNPSRAGEALTRLRPDIAIPIHWGTLCPIGMKWMRPRFLTSPPQEFFQIANNVAPEVDVRIVSPGNHLRFGPDVI